MTATEWPGPEPRADTEALRSLSTAYASAVDQRDGDRLAALFVDSGELLVPDGSGDARPVTSRVGHESLRRVPDGLRRYAQTFHQVSNHRFEIDGDRATGEVLCVAHHVMAARPEQAADQVGPDDQAGTDDQGGTDTVWFIRYLDAYVRTDRGWRFERRALHLQWVEEYQVSVLPSGAGTERLRPLS